MKFKIVMVNGDYFVFENKEFNSLEKFIESQLCKRWYIINPKENIAILIKNILMVQEYKNE
jgi:hypothetical protein